MPEELKNALPPGLLWGILCAVTIMLENLGYSHVARVFDNPETARIVNDLLQSALAILAGISRGYHKKG